ncbi:MAG: sugar phosphate isomerase/epimerase [Anaerolineae bacterium]|nr:sugar phosphate isomerase/epimerase [Anaerolineae bacterium]
MPMQLGVQLYTLREPCASDFHETLRHVAAMGLRVVETAGLHGQSPTTVRGWLDDLGLSAPAAHVGLDFETGEVGPLIEEARAMGYETLVLPWVGREQYADGWDGFARRLEPIARKLREAGLRFAYHNHDFEFERAADGRVGLDVLFETADPDLVEAEIDTYWVQYAGLDPAAYISKYAGRVPYVHLKDMSSTPDRADVEGGKGILDWEAILAACEGAGVRYGIIEMDNPPGDPIECVRTSVEFFRAKGLT